MRVLVCGGRDFNKKQFVDDYLDYVRQEYGPIEVLISGQAKGTDELAEAWAIFNWIPYVGYKADWNTHGRAAGPIRNQQMLDEGKPDIVIAFPGGRGTADMVSRAKKAGVKVIEVIDG